MNRLLVIALALLVPLSYTTQTKSLRTEDVVALGVFGTLFVGIPVAVGSYLLYKKIRLANRTDDEVYQDAQEFLHKAQATYAAHAAMLDEITPDLTYRQTIDLQRPIIDKANIAPNFFNPYPLIAFVNTLRSVITELTNHDTWLKERLAKFDAELEADYVAKFNALSVDIKAFRQRLYSLSSLIYNSNDYHHQRVLQLEALARANKEIVIY